MAQPSALLVAHGYPSQPGPTEAAMQRLAGAVGAYLPGWQLRGATLAAPGALEQALDGLDAPLIYPFFMAEGWFTKTVLPQRLAQAGRPNLRQLQAFGSDPGLAALVAAQVQAACKAQGWQLQDSALLLAAHGSQRARASALGAQGMAAQLAQLLALRGIRCAFVEEAPFLADAAQGMGQALCLPFFALAASHVLEDIPAAMAKAGFAGPILPPIGAAPSVPSLISAALMRGA